MTCRNNSSSRVIIIIIAAAAIAIITAVVVLTTTANPAVIVLILTAAAATTTIVLATITTHCCCYHCPWDHHHCCHCHCSHRPHHYYSCCPSSLLSSKPSLATLVSMHLLQLIAVIIAHPLLAYTNGVKQSCKSHSTECLLDLGEVCGCSSVQVLCWNMECR